MTRVRLQNSQIRYDANLASFFKTAKIPGPSENHPVCTLAPVTTATALMTASAFMTALDQIPRFFGCQFGKKYDAN
jgi:hypothetical protein